VVVTSNHKRWQGGPDATAAYYRVGYACVIHASSHFDGGGSRGSAGEGGDESRRAGTHIAQDGDKDDPIDAPKLGQLYRGNFISAVHHPESLERSAFKQLVGLYHDRVRNTVRHANRIAAQFRRHGICTRRRELLSMKGRQALLQRVPAKCLRTGIRVLLEEFDLARESRRAGTTWPGARQSRRAGIVENVEGRPCVPLRVGGCGAGRRVGGSCVESGWLNRVPARRESPLGANRPGFRARVSVHEWTRPACYARKSSWTSAAARVPNRWLGDAGSCDDRLNNEEHSTNRATQ